MHTLQSPILVLDLDFSSLFPHSGLRGGSGSNLRGASHISEPHDTYLIEVCLCLLFTGISEFLAHPVPEGVSEGSVARFWCTVAASPQATITWELNQSPLPLQTDR